MAHRSARFPVLLALSAPLLVASCERQAPPDPASGGATAPAAQSAQAGAAQSVSAEAPADVKPPPLDGKRFIFQPSFVSASGASFAAGKAVPMKASGTPGGVVVLSCHHIFGPSGGLTEEVPARELPAFLKETTLQDLDGKKISIGPALHVPHAKSFKLPDASGDVSVFQAPAELAPHALELAATLPRQGDRIWLIAKLTGKEPLLHPARVKHSEEKLIVYEFDAPDLQLPGTSGSPLVDGAGRLVALNLGGGSMPTGELRAFGITAPSLRRALVPRIH